MLSKIIMPSVGQTTNELVITKWHKKVGDSVERGDVLFEVESDKANLEVESFAKGILKAIYFKEGETAYTHQLVAYIGSEADVLPDAENSNDLDDTLDEQDDYAPIISKDLKEEEQVNEINKKFNEILMASPKARKIANENAIDINNIFNQIEKTVKSSDVLAFVNNEKASSSNEEHYLIDTTSMRRSIASKMFDSLTNSTQYTISMDINMAKVLSFRKSINDWLGEQEAKISLNDILMKSTAKAIKKFPLINSVYGEKQIKIYNSVNCGLAVSIEGGLVVPVILDIQNKSLAEIAIESQAAIKSVKSGDFNKKLMSKGTITISNLGMLGVKHFTAILNYPESCILAIGKIEDKLTLDNGNVKAIPTMNITATFDHRVIDGAYGAEFLNEIKKFIESPELLAY